MRKIHKRLEEPPEEMESSEVECGVEYANAATDNWDDVTCQKCLDKRKEDALL